MSFAAPAFLAAILVLPAMAALWALQRRRRRRYPVRHPATAIVARVRTSGSAWRRRTAPALLALAALCMVVALARPQTTVAVPVERASVLLVTDQSGSMLADDVEPTRLEAAQKAAASFLDQVPDGLLVGFVGYSNAVRSLLEPTTERGSVEAAIDGLRADGGTATGDALAAALDRLQARKAGGRTAPAAIVLLSDGKTTEGADPLEAAARAARLRIPIYTVALGTPEGVVTGPSGEPIAVPPDRETLRAISARSGGTAFTAEEAGDLDRVYERLGSRIGTRREEREVSAAFAAGGLILLLGGVGAGLRWRGRLV